MLYTDVTYIWKVEDTYRVIEVYIMMAIKMTPASAPALIPPIRVISVSPDDSEKSYHTTDYH